MIVGDFVWVTRPGNVYLKLLPEPFVHSVIHGVDVLLGKFGGRFLGVDDFH